MIGGEGGGMKGDEVYMRDSYLIMAVCRSTRPATSITQKFLQEKAESLCRKTYGEEKRN